jgi:hypothetical protein
MKAALLNLAREEVIAHGHVLDPTRQRLRSLGVDSAQLEAYLINTGAN